MPAGPYALKNRAALRSPRCQNSVNLMGYPLAGSRAIHPLSQQFVVFGMFMPNRCNHCRSQSPLLQIPTRLRAANAPASSGGGMFGDCSEFMSWAGGEQNPDLFRHASNQLAVCFAPSHGLARASSCPFIRIFRTFPLGSFQCRRLNEDTLSLVMLSSPAEADNHGAARAMLRCSPR